MNLNHARYRGKMQ